MALNLRQMSVYKFGNADLACTDQLDLLCR
jgi:hypothetical protein